jgi:hypothetical protein
MTETWMQSGGGTYLEGPVEAWSHPDAYWTEEFGAAVAAAREARQPVACPVCGEDAFSLDMDRVYGVHHDVGQPFESFSGGLGWLATLGPCGHRLAQ